MRREFIYLFFFYFTNEDVQELLHKTVLHLNSITRFSNRLHKLNGLCVNPKSETVKLEILKRDKLNWKRFVWTLFGETRRTKKRERERERKLSSDFFLQLSSLSSISPIHFNLSFHVAPLVRWRERERDQLLKKANSVLLWLMPFSIYEKKPEEKNVKATLISNRISQVEMTFLHVEGVSLPTTWDTTNSILHFGRDRRDNSLSEQLLSTPDTV